MAWHGLCSTNAEGRKPWETSAATAELAVSGVVSCQNGAWHGITEGIANESQTVTVSGDYRLVFLDAPEVPVTRLEKYFRGWDAEAWSAQIDWPRLLLPITVVALLTLGACISLRGRADNARKE